MENLSLGASAPGVPNVMCKLDVSHGRSVFVLSGDGPDVHAYLYSMYYEQCQAYNYKSFAYAFYSFSYIAPHDFNNLYRSKDQNMPMAVERRDS